MSTMRPAEARSLALLLELAAGSPRPQDVLRAQARVLPRRMRRLAEATAASWERGESLPPDLRGGAGCSLKQALRLMTARAEAGEAAARAITRRALVPVLTASFALIAASLALAVAAPAVHALVEETSVLLGSPPPSPLLAFLARHATAILCCGATAAAALAAMPLALPRLALTRAGGSLVARLPIASRLQAALAVRDFAARLAAALRAGLPPHEAATRAADDAATPWARARLRRAASRLHAGEPPDAAFDDAELPLLASLRAALLDPEEGLGAARQAEDLALEQARATASLLGRLAAGAAGALTFAALAVLTLAVLVPLATLGGIGP